MKVNLNTVFDCVHELFITYVACLANSKYSYDFLLVTYDQRSKHNDDRGK